MTRRLPRLAGEIFNRALMIEPGYGLAALAAISERLGIVNWGGGQRADGGDLADAGAYDIRRQADWREGTFDAADGVAYIPIEGMLVHRFGLLDPVCGMLTGYDGISYKLRAAARDPKVRGIVLDIHSPGGIASGCFPLARQIRDVAGRKPVLAIINEEACSAAYALAAAAGNVVATPGAQIGSIGVWTLHSDFSRMLDHDGITVTMIYAGEQKIDGHPYAPLPEDVRARIQASVDATRLEFAQSVADHRGLSLDQVMATKAGVFRGPEALELGLIDAIADPIPAMDDFIAALDSQPAPAA